MSVVAEFTHWESLTRGMNAKIKKILKNDVAPVMKEALASHVQEDVLNTYTPTIYKRRARGGIDDPKNITTEMVDDNTILVTNVATPSKSVMGEAYLGADPTDFFQWIEYGKVRNIFNTRTDYVWTKKRPAVQRTQIELNHSGKLKSTIRDAIDREIRGS